MIFAKSYTESISFEAAYEFFGHSQLEPPFLNEIRIISDYYEYDCYFSIKSESYKIEINLSF